MFVRPLNKHNEQTYAHCVNVYGKNHQYTKGKNMTAFQIACICLLLFVCALTCECFDLWKMPAGSYYSLQHCKTKVSNTRLNYSHLIWQWTFPKTTCLLVSKEITFTDSFTEIGQVPSGSKRYDTVMVFQE